MIDGCFPNLGGGQMPAGTSTDGRRKTVQKYADAREEENLIPSEFLDELCK